MTPRLVKVLIGHFAGHIGTLEDAIPCTDWFNVRVNNMRLALTREEFELL